MQVQFLGREDPLRWEMATHSSALAWKIPGTEELGGLHTFHGIAEVDTNECTYTHTHTHTHAHHNMDGPKDYHMKRNKSKTNII